MGFQIVANVASFMGRSYEKLIFQTTHKFRHIRHTGYQALRATSGSSVKPITSVVFSPPPSGRFF